MGGKKPIGEHPSRGHLQRRFTSTFRRGGHRHHGDGSAVDDDGAPVVQQEFSLFSQFDSTPNRFGILTANDKTELRTHNVDVSHLPMEEKNDINVISEIHSLQCNMGTLIAAFERLQYDFYSSTNQAYMYGMYQVQGESFRGSLFPNMPSEEPQQNPDFEQVVKRINERLSTLEGRQKSIQSKISQLDSLYGQSSSSWSKSIKKILASQVGDAANTQSSSDPVLDAKDSYSDNNIDSQPSVSPLEVSATVSGVAVISRDRGSGDNAESLGDVGVGRMEYLDGGAIDEIPHLSFTAHSSSCSDSKEVPAVYLPRGQQMPGGEGAEIYGSAVMSHNERRKPTNLHHTRTSTDD